ncbi:MAG: heavy-metal-associated domain-containing protein [Acidobacteria bacterium]|nr:heavy-metal-associated domain-containing protein [Acidobacteriota bacterium]
MSTIALKIDGMHCQSCVARVRRALENVDGITINEVQVGSASVDTENPDAAIAAVNKAGYPAHVL